jgi:DNA-directed RNA polymerase subunit delta
MGTKSDKAFSKDKNVRGDNSRSTRLKPLNPKDNKNWKASYDEDIDDDDEDVDDEDNFDKDDIEEDDSTETDEDFNLEEDLSDPAFDDDDDDEEEEEFFDDSDY